MSSGNGPCFIAEVVQVVAKFLQIKWDLHAPWRPQSQAKAEQMNPALKREVLKLFQKTPMKWVDVLPVALMRIQVTPRVREGLNSFEILYGKPCPVNNLAGKEDQMHETRKTIVN